jgi:hypothetical protein
MSVDTVYCHIQFATDKPLHSKIRIIKTSEAIRITILMEIFDPLDSSTRNSTPEQVRLSYAELIELVIGRDKM